MRRFPQRTAVRVRGWLRQHRARLWDVLRMTTSTAVAFALGAALDLAESFWAVIAALIVTQSSLGGTLKAGLEQFVGSVFGAVWGAAITHSLVDPHAHAPTGWSLEFGRRVQDAVLFGFTAFTHDDARHAAARLLERGSARTKPARASAGRDQTVISTAAELEAVLKEIEPAELSHSGLVLEENLTDVVTYSVGQVRVAELVATYHGIQRLITDNRGEAVYGGSDLVVARGEFDALLGLDLSDEVRLAVSQACIYDTAAMELYPGLFASRRNYDVAAGLGSQGQRRCGVLEQSWRMGGASGAEIAALEAFRAEPTLEAICASTFETYGAAEPPPHAIVYFRAEDEQIGPMTKYTIVRSEEHR